MDEQIADITEFMKKEGFTLNRLAAVLNKSQTSPTLLTFSLYPSQLFVNTGAIREYFAGSDATVHFMNNICIVAF